MRRHKSSSHRYLGERFESRNMVSSYVLILLMLSGGTAFGGKTSIPLSECWTTGSPGTQSLLAAAADEPELSVAVKSAQAALGKSAAGRDQSPPGVVAVGSIEEALRAALPIIKGNVATAKAVTSGQGVNLVIYAYASTHYTYLHSVQREGRSITVRYRLVPKRHRNLPSLLGVVPLGKLQAGTYTVSMARLPLSSADALSPVETKAIVSGITEPPAEAELRQVSSGFDFEVLDNR